MGQKVLKWVVILMVIAFVRQLIKNATAEPSSVTLPKWTPQVVDKVSMRELDRFLNR